MPDSAGLICPVGLDWRNGQPSLRVKDSASGTSKLMDLVGMRFNYAADARTERQCLGHVPWRTEGHDYVDCQAPPVRGARLCNRCGAVAGAFAANLHHAHTRGAGEIDPVVAEHLRAPNLLYLAAFRDGSVKIGTSRQTRLATRLNEQGAWMARIVAAASDGYAVREIEDRVTEELDIGQTVNVSRKLRGMLQPVAETDLETELSAVAAEVHELLATAGDDRLTVTDEAWNNPRAGNAAFVRTHRYPLDLADGTHDFEVIDACGPVIAITRPASSDVFVTSFKPITGLMLATGDFESDTIALQDSLF